MFPALGLVEVSSIARGMVVSDRCVKKAPVTLIASNPISPGRFLSLFWGDVASVEASMQEGMEVAGDALVDHLYLPGAHPAILDLLTKRSKPAEIDSLGIVETHSVSSALLAADAALKAADVGLLELRLASGLAGKGYFVLSGSLDSVEASLDAARNGLLAVQLVSVEVIPRPDPEFTRFLL